MTRRFVALLASTCISTMAYAPAAWAQADPAAEDEAGEKDTIVVTGTQIRGVAPAGTESIAISIQDIKETGGFTTYEVLSELPQVSFFNRLPDSGTGQPHAINQPTIHGLPVLIMIDGHRIAASGSNAAAPAIDPSIIPTGVLTGIELVPDGGSAIYGSDAVGGVINMSTIKKFDGLKLDGTVGFADDYTAWRITATGGKEWSTGSVFAAYSYNHSNAVFGSSRPWLVRNPLLAANGPLGTVFNPAVTGATPLPAVSYIYTGVDANGKPVGYTTGTQAFNRYLNETIQPEEEMHSVIAGLSQDIGDRVHVDVRGFYSTRKTTSFNDFSMVFESPITIPLTNPFRTATPAPQVNAATPRAQQISFSLAPALGRNANPALTQLDTWGISGELKWDVGSSFQVRALANYSQSDYHARSNGTGTADTALLNVALARSDPATALDPYNVAATPGSILAAQQIAGLKAINDGRTTQSQFRLVTDGTLFHLPGGDVKIAVGGEVLHETFALLAETRDFAGTLLATPARQAVNVPRTVTSAFGEVQVPIISPEQNGPIYGMHFSAAARYDHYSDFGNTFNPRFGLSVMPVEWLTFRATYGKSFVAPSLQELNQVRAGTISNSVFLLPSQVGDPDQGRFVVVLTGGNASLKPQKARTWSLGMDFKAPFAEGLRASLTYYNVHFTDLLGNPPAIGGFATFFSPLYQNFWIKNPTLAQALAFADGVPASGAGFTSIEQLYATGNAPAYITTNRRSNLGVQNTSGIDFSLDYKQPMSFGSLDFGIAGNYTLSNDQSVVAGGTFTDSLAFATKFRGSASIGANIDAFRFKTELLHTGAFNLAANAFGQTSVKAYNTVNLFLGYTFKDRGVLADTAVSLNVTNLFNVRPPVNQTAGTGYAFGNYLLRTIQLGLSKKF